jgi:two-component system response regulator MprA
MTPHRNTNPTATPLNTLPERSAATAWILVIDADAGTQAAASRPFQPNGGNLAEASDGSDVVAKAPAQPPALVITEFRLPLVDGYALCDILRRRGTTADVLIFRL